MRKIEVLRAVSNSLISLGFKMTYCSGDYRQYSNKNYYIRIRPNDKEILKDGHVYDKIGSHLVLEACPAKVFDRWGNSAHITSEIYYVVYSEKGRNKGAEKLTKCDVYRDIDEIIRKIELVHKLIPNQLFNNFTIYEINI